MKNETPRKKMESKVDFKIIKAAVASVFLMLTVMLSTSYALAQVPTATNVSYFKSGTEANIYLGEINGQTYAIKVLQGSQGPLPQEWINYINSTMTPPQYGGLPTVDVGLVNLEYDGVAYQGIAMSYTPGSISVGQLYSNYMNAIANGTSIADLPAISPEGWASLKALIDEQYANGVAYSDLGIGNLIVLPDGTPKLIDNALVVPGDAATELSIKNGFYSFVEDAMKFQQQVAQGATAATAAGAPALEADFTDAVDGEILATADASAAWVGASPTAGGLTLNLLDVYGASLTAPEVGNILQQFWAGYQYGNQQIAASVMNWVDENLPGISGFLSENATVLGNGMVFLQAFGLAVQQVQLFTSAINADAQGLANYGNAFASVCDTACEQGGTSLVLSTAVADYFNGVPPSIANGEPGTTVANFLYNPNFASNQTPTYVVVPASLLPSNYPPCLGGAVTCAEAQGYSSVSMMPDGSSVQRYPNGDVQILQPTGQPVTGIDPLTENPASYPVYTVFESPAGSTQLEPVGVISQPTGFIGINTGSSPLLDNISSALVQTEVPVAVDIENATMTALLDYQQVEEAPTFEVTVPDDSLANEANALGVNSSNLDSGSCGLVQGVNLAANLGVTSMTPTFVMCTYNTPDQSGNNSSNPTTNSDGYGGASDTNDGGSSTSTSATNTADSTDGSATTDTGSGNTADNTTSSGGGDTNDGGSNTGGGGGGGGSGDGGDDGCIDGGCYTN